MKSKSILTYIIYGGLALLLFVPLIVSNEMYFPFITGKNFAFRVLVEVIVGSWVILAIQYPKYRPRFSWILGAFGSLVAVMFLAALFGVNTYDSIWSNFERMEGWVTLLHVFGLFVAAGSVLQTRKQWKRLFATSAFVSAIVAFMGIMQLTGNYEIHQGGTRLDATLGNATYLAAYMLFHIFVTGWLLWERVRERIQENLSYLTDYGVWWYAPLILVQAFILFNTATRGAILGLLAGAGLTALLIAIFQKKRPRMRKGAIALIVAFVVLTGGFLAVKDTQFVQEQPVLSRFANIDLQGKTVRSRFMIWNMALEGFARRPVLGWGQGNFNYIFNENYDPRMYDQEQWFDRAHNVVLDWLTGGGIIGFLIYIGLFGSALYYLWQRDRQNNTTWGVIKKRLSSVLSYVHPDDSREGFSITEKALFTGLFAAYFFHNLFVFDNITSYMMFALVLAFIHSQTAREWNVLDGETPRKDNRRIATTAVVVLMLGSVYIFNYNGYMQAHALIDSLRLQNSGRFDQALEEYDRTLAYDSYGTQETREQLLQAAVTLVRSEDAPERLKNEFFTRAEEEMKKQIQEDPLGTRHRYFLASLYHHAGEHEKAIPHFEDALERSPGKQPIMFDLAVSHMRLGQHEEAFNILKQAYESAPTYLRARKLYATAAIYAERYDVVKELSNDIDETWRDAAIEANEEMPQKQRQQLAQFHVSIASVYANIGEFDRAIEEVEKAIEILPQFEKQGQQFIDELQKGNVPGGSGGGVPAPSQ